MNPRVTDILLVLGLFTDLEADTRQQVNRAHTHPRIDRNVPIRGFIYDVHTGTLAEVI